MRYRIDIKSTVTLLLIINVVVYFLTNVLPIPTPQGILVSFLEKEKNIVVAAAQRYGLAITLFSVFPVLIRDLGWAWQVFTYMFLHGSPLHLFFNMYALFLFGRQLEQRWGTREFLFYYLFTGVGAGVVTFFWNLARAPYVPTIGASGAIFGLILAFGLEFPEAVLLLFFVIPVRARYAAFIFGAIELVMILTGAMRGIGHFTHIAGLLFGFVYYFARIKPRYGGGYASSFKRMKQRLSKDTFSKRELSNTQKDSTIKSAGRLREKIRRGESLTSQDMAFLSRLKEAYYGENAQLCDFEEFSMDEGVCRNCDSLDACLYRYIMKE